MCQGRLSRSTRLARGVMPRLKDKIRPRELGQSRSELCVSAHTEEYLLTDRLLFYGLFPPFPLATLLSDCEMLKCCSFTDGIPDAGAADRRGLPGGPFWPRSNRPRARPGTLLAAESIWCHFICQDACSFFCVVLCCVRCVCVCLLFLPISPSPFFSRVVWSSRGIYIPYTTPNCFSLWRYFPLRGARSI